MRSLRRNRAPDFFLESLPVRRLDRRIDRRFVLLELTCHIGLQRADLIARGLSGPFVRVDQCVAYVDRSEQHLGPNRKQELLTARKARVNRRIACLGFRQMCGEVVR
jgi:hypothetical protein